MNSKKSWAMLSVSSHLASITVGLKPLGWLRLRTLLVEEKTLVMNKEKECWHCVLVGVNDQYAECLVCEHRVPWGDREPAGIAVMAPFEALKENPDCVYSLRENS